MKKLLLLATAVLFLTQCNNSREQKPDAERAIKDTFAQLVMQPFNTKPVAKKLYARFEPKDKDIPRPQSAAIRNLMASMQAQPQHFVIDATELNELQGEYGTKISIKPNSFITGSGKEISSAVNIELKECYALNEMLEENLTTCANGKILESKAAVYVSATCNGEELKLKEGEKINIEFPFAVNQHNGYSFYYGEQKHNNFNWALVNEKEESASAKNPVAKPEFNYKGYTLEEYLTSQLEYTDEAKRNELSANVEVSFVVDKNGKVKDVSCTSAFKTFRDEITATLQQMPKWKPAAFGKKKISAQVKLNVDFNLRRKEQVVVAFNDDNILPLANNNEVVFDNAVYSQSFGRLGWIGCHRILANTKLKADVVISSNQNSDVKIVLKNRNTIVGGENCLGYSRFKNLGVGEEVYVMAVRHEEGRVLYALEPITLTKQTVVSLVWKKSNEEEVKRVFRSIS
jgi:TonB family protein